MSAQLWIVVIVACSLLLAGVTLRRGARGIL